MKKEIPDKGWICVEGNPVYVDITIQENGKYIECRWYGKRGFPLKVIGSIDSDIFETERECIEYIIKGYQDKIEVLKRRL